MLDSMKGEVTGIIYTWLKRKSYCFTLQISSVFIIDILSSSIFLAFLNFCG